MVGCRGMLRGHRGTVGGPGQGSSGPLVRRFMYEGGIGGGDGEGGKGVVPAGPDRSRPIFTSRISAASRSVPSACSIKCPGVY